MSQVNTRQLLLDCLRAKTDPVETERFKGITRTDWENVITESVRLGVASLLYYQLEMLGSRVNVPVDLLRVLREDYLESTARNLRLYNKLGQLLKLLQQENIPMIVLKGAYLAEVVYKKVGLRPMKDLDLLVRRADLPRVENLLRELGYSSDEKNITGHAEICSHYGYISPDLDLELFLEIHWSIEGTPSPFSVDVDGLWERAEPVVIAGARAFVLAPEDFLLHLCLHTSFHHLFRDAGLRSLYDISETIRYHQDRIDWLKVQQRSRQWGASNCVYLTLYLAQRLLGADVAKAVLRSLKSNDFDPHFITRAEERIFVRPEVVAGPESDNWGRFWASRRLGDKSAVFLQSCFPSPRRLAQMYALPPSSRWLYLYYLVRLKDLVQRHAHRAWLLLRRDSATHAWIESEAKRVERNVSVDQVMDNDLQMMAWIKEDAERAEQFRLVKWLAGGSGG